MRIRINWKKVLIITLDVVLAAYIVVAMTASGKPNEAKALCTKVTINIEDEMSNGFLTVGEIKHRLQSRSLYPLAKPLNTVDVRQIEETLLGTPFVKAAQVWKTQGGQVCINLSQRTPLLRIKSANGDDYYVDDHNKVMPNTKYVSDLVIATGSISRAYAQSYLSSLSRAIMASDLWKNQVEQINILPGGGVELVPRVGSHIIYIGQLPTAKTQTERDKLIKDYVDGMFDRLEKFYRYGLSQAGWNKYNYINLEFDNQIICRRADGGRSTAPMSAPVAAPKPVADSVAAKQSAAQSAAPAAEKPAKKEPEKPARKVEKQPEKQAPKAPAKAAAAPRKAQKATTTKAKN